MDGELGQYIFICNLHYNFNQISQKFSCDKLISQNSSLSTVSLMRHTNEAHSVTLM